MKDSWSPVEENVKVTSSLLDIIPLFIRYGEQSSGYSGMVKVLLKTLLSLVSPLASSAIIRIQYVSGSSSERVIK